MVTKIEVNLPKGWSLVEYSELNHHITLMDSHGHTIRLNAEHMVEYKCLVCGEILYAHSNHGNIKCFCGERLLPSWGKAKMCFVPEILVEADTDPQIPKVSVS